MTCTFWQSRQAQCGRASVAVIGTKLALCGDHASDLKSQLRVFTEEVKWARDVSLNTFLKTIGYQETA